MPIATLRNDDDAAFLRPGHGDEPALVLFVDPAQARSRSALEELGRVRPEALQVVALDVTRAQDTAAWFGIRETPTLAVVADGALLSLAGRCDAGSCDATLREAWSHIRRLRSEGVL
jgi:thioredoxin-like negative regulator of GroEL